MRVLELEIQNVRGILNLSLKPAGKNFVIWGPNGSGKSAVVDAIDFLLTGRVSRLTGKGTGGITLSKHGPHIDHRPEEAVVRAIIQLPGVKDPVELKRCMAKPNILECEMSLKSVIEPVMALARRGQHVLTRREILKYITAEANTRAQEIQELLNITDIEDVRKVFVKVRNDLDKDLQSSKRALEIAKGAVNATIQEKTFQKDAVLYAANQNRKILGGGTISTLHSKDLKTGLVPPIVASSDKAINVTLLERDIQNLANVTVPQNQTLIAKNDEELRALITTVRSDPQLLQALSHLQLTKLGMELIDETGKCPLCDTPWPPGKLREYLEQRLLTAKVAEQYQERIKGFSSGISDSINATVASIQKVISAARIVGLEEDLSILQSWLANLQDLSSILGAAIEKYPDPRYDLNQVKNMLAPINIDQTLTGISSTVSIKYPKTTPEQTAWDTLTRLEENLKALEEAENTFKIVELSQGRAIILLDSFQAARDKVLGELYEDIRDRFVNLYLKLHGIDEEKFKAKIGPEGAGLNFEVDFYGRGTHPPHALHSEGHQDSMGICLYLALAERLTGGLIDLIILDDVVMSVDADHRRQVCHLLLTSFPRRQFLITTHDKTWANQLKSEGVVSSGGIFEFYNWNVDTGPQVSYEVDMWERIEEDIQRNDVPAAAGRLRRGLEQFYGMVCDALQARVIYKLTGQWDLGDLLPAAMREYRSLLKRGKESAQSWGEKDRFDMLQELDSIVGSIYARSNAEQWAINASIHYNNWANLSAKDFRPVVEAFQDLCGLFVCSNCSGMLHIVVKGFKPEGVRCKCGKVDWNLIEKGTTS